MRRPLTLSMPGWRVNLRTAFAIALSCFAFIAQSTDSRATELKVTLVLSDDNPVYLRFAETYKSKLSGNQKLEVLHSPDRYFATGQTADLIVTVGSQAARYLAGKTSTPMLLTMLPSTIYKQLARQRTSPMSASYVDQPWSRHVELLFATLPRTRRVGMLYSPGAEIDTDALRQLIANHDAKLVASGVDAPARLFDTLEQTLNQSDVLLAVPDNAIYSSNNIRNILMTSYRHNIPLIGLSKGYVNAGALCAVYSEPEDLALQASAMTLSFALNRSLPPPQYPIIFHVATNPEVARTLGIKLKAEDVLHALLLRAEGRQ